MGDRLGRKPVLGMTILLMAGATLCVGLIPSYDSIRFWAPVLLIALRMIQGFSTGGEYGGAATFMAEYAPDRKRGYCGSFLEFGALAGFSLGAFLMLSVSAVLSDARMEAWGWRLPFLVAAPLGLIGRTEIPRRKPATGRFRRGLEREPEPAVAAKDAAV